MRKVLTVLCLTVLSGLLCGCANDFDKFYHDKTLGVPPDVLARRLQPYSGTTQIFSTQDPQNDAEIARRRGYVLLGVSSFQGGRSVTEEMLRDQGQAVGADMILYRSHYQGSEQVAMPFTSYQPGQTSTTYSSGTVNANAYGSRGYAYGTGTYSGTSTTTTPGTYSTTVVPTTVHRYSHEALFWRKGKPLILGINVVNLTDDIRQKLQRNTGDVVVGIDNVPIDTMRDFTAKVPQFAGKKIDLHILRDEKEMIITVQTNAPQDQASNDGK